MPKVLILPDRLENEVVLCVFNPCHAEQIVMPSRLLIFNQSDYFDSECLYKFIYLMTISAVVDQLTSSEANRSGYTLFAKAGHIRVQQDQG